MPTVPISLGKYVVVRPRKDGTSRVLFEVPARLRPSDWSPAISLPLEGPRRGDLSDADEVSRIQRDAKRLYERLQEKRTGRDAGDGQRSMRSLVRAFEGSQGYKATKPRTQKSYSEKAAHIIKWAKRSGDPSPGKLTRAQAEGFLALFDDRPTTRRHLKIVLKMLMDQAIALGWRTDNPVERIKMKVPQSTVNIWEAADVEFYADACTASGHPAIAALIRTQWEIGQRLTDARLFRRLREYDEAAGVFRFYQSKTRSYVTIPISDALRAVLEACRREGSIYLFTDRETGQPYTEPALAHTFQVIRDRTGPSVHRVLVLRALRHSCVVQLARVGCTVPEIASITGHSLASAQAILSRYLPRDNAVAFEAQAKRGLIVRKVSGTEV